MALTEPSPDGNLLLYGVAASGSDWQEFKIRRVTDGVDLSDHLRWIKFSGAAWTRDGKGFFYSRYPEPRTGEAMVGQNRDMKVYYHRIGTVQTDDVLVYERLDQPDWGFGVHVTHDGRYLVMAVWVGTDTRQRIHYLDLVDPLLPKVTGTVVRLLDHADAAYAFIGNQGPLFQFRTDRDAPRGRVIAIDTEAPGAEIRETIPEEPDALESVAQVGGRLVATYLVDAKSSVRVFEWDGRAVREVTLPGIGTAAGDVLRLHVVPVAGNGLSL